MFELLSGGLVEYLANILKENDLKFGFGGVARLNTGTLSANLILSEHRRLGSSQVILSRDINNVFSNCNDKDALSLFNCEVKKIRDYNKELERVDDSVLMKNKRELSAVVGQFTLAAE